MLRLESVCRAAYDNALPKYIGEEHHAAVRRVPGAVSHC